MRTDYPACTCPRCQRLAAPLAVASGWRRVVAFLGAWAALIGAASLALAVLVVLVGALVL